MNLETVVVFIPYQSTLGGDLLTIFTTVGNNLCCDL
jgi:Flp pilus assembly pilin Flp